MNKHSIGKILMALAVCVSLLAGNSVTAYASTQEVQGTDTQTKDIKVTADIQSVSTNRLPSHSVMLLSAHVLSLLKIRWSRARLLCMQWLLMNAILCGTCFAIMLKIMF